MRETETSATPFASPAWLGGVFKYYRLKSGGLRWLHKSSQMSPDRIFSFPSSQSQVLLQLADRQRQRGQGPLTQSLLLQLPPRHLASGYLLSIHSWGLRIYNRHLSHHPAPSALNITLSSAALQDTDDRRATRAAAQRDTSRGLPQATLTRAFIYPSHWEGQREKKA